LPEANFVPGELAVPTLTGKSIGSRVMLVVLLCAGLVVAHGSHGLVPDALGGVRDALPLEDIDTSNCLAEGTCTAQHLHLLQRGQEILRLDAMKAAAKKKRDGENDDEKEGADEEDTNVEMDRTGEWICHADKTENAAISGHNWKKYRSGTRSVEWCINECCKTPECKSVDYWKNEKWCDLSNKRASDVGGLKTDYDNDPYDHYDLPKKCRQITLPASGSAHRRRQLTWSCEGRRRSGTLGLEDGPRPSWVGDGQRRRRGPCDHVQCSAEGGCGSSQCVELTDQDQDYDCWWDYNDTDSLTGRTSPYGTCRSNATRHRRRSTPPCHQNGGKEEKHRRRRISRRRCGNGLECEKENGYEPEEGCTPDECARRRRESPRRRVCKRHGQLLLMQHGKALDARKEEEAEEVSAQKLNATSDDDGGDNDEGDDDEGDDDAEKHLHAPGGDDDEGDDGEE